MLQESWRIKLRINRKLIDISDSLMMRLLAWRMGFCKRIGAIKVEKKLPIHMPDREAEIITNKRQLAEKYDIADDCIIEIFQIIMRESKRIQNEISQTLTKKGN